MRSCVLGLLLLLAAHRGLAYEFSTHAALTREAYRASLLNPATGDVLLRLGLSENDSQIGTLMGTYVDLSSPQLSFRSAHPTGDNGAFGQLRFDAANNLSAFRPAFYSVPGWLMLGAIREDDIPGGDTPHDDPAGSFYRVGGHFFDPVHDHGLQLGVTSPFVSARDWALRPDASVTFRSNDFRLGNVRETMFRALTLKTIDGGGKLVDVTSSFFLDPSFGIRTKEDVRKAYWAGTFRGLGDVVHLVEDMAQPQHTRNDPHAGTNILGTYPFGRQSYYELLIEARVTGGALSLLTENFAEGYSVVETTPMVVGPPPAFGALNPVSFNGYDDYFATATGPLSLEGAGLANYSNAGFYSAGTNAKNTVFESPPADGSLQQVDLPPGTATNATGGLVSGILSLMKGSVADAAHLEPTATNVSLSSFGAFDQFLLPAGKRQFSLNHYNYDDQARLLLPRAVAYSAGLLNYFFRGRMEISLPEQGVYGIVDHSLFGGPNPTTNPVSGFKGFHWIRLRLKNTTPDVTPADGPGAIPQDMPGGTLVAVFKFHRNTCYRDDLSGEITDGAQVDACRSSEEEIVVSKPYSGAGRVPPPSEAPDGKAFVFEFPDELPINAWDVVLQVVYRGPLGMETDAVVAATKDISEPTYITVGNYSDYNLLKGGFHTGAEIAGDDTLWNALNPFCRDTSSFPRRDACANVPLTLSLSFGTPQATVVVRMSKTDPHDGRVAARRFARIAVLGDAPAFGLAQKTVQASLVFDNPPFYLDGATAFDFPTYENQLKDPQHRTASPFAASRGVRFWDAIFFVIDGATIAATGLPNVTVLDGDPLAGAERLASPVEIVGWDPPP